MLRYGKLGHENVQLVLQHSCKKKLKNDVARFKTHIQICLATNQVVAGCETLLLKVESSSTYCNKSVSVHVAPFTGRRQTCFAQSDVNPVYGVTPA